MRYTGRFILNLFTRILPEFAVNVTHFFHAEVWNRPQIRNVLISLIAFGLLTLYIVLKTRDYTLQITFVSLIYVFIFLPLCFRTSRNRILSIIGIENYSFAKTAIISISIVLLLIPFTLYVLTSIPNSPIKPETTFNPYYLIPDSFRFYLIIISATLGGLVLTASNNSKLDITTRRDFVNVSKKFIVATILLILFVVFLYNSNIFGNIDPTRFEEHITVQGAYIAVMFWVSVLCFYIGVVLFLTGIIEFIISLSTASLRE